MSDFAANLKQFRKRKKYSQATLARKLNYGHTTIANYESGRNEPSIDDLIKIAIILDISLDELVGKNPSKKEECFLQEIPIYCSFQAHLRRLSPCRFRHCGEGFGKGNLVSLSSSAEVWNPLRNGFQVFVTF